MVTGTIVVCTRNRQRLLAQCLASLDEQLSHDDLEVLVVDNASTDATSDLLRCWRSGARRRRVAYEASVGLSAARNVGLAAAEGEVVLFCDDDALAPVGWARHHLDVYDRRPDVVSVGGPVMLSFPSGRPPWLTPRLEHWWSALDGGDEPGPFPPPHGPYGTNVSVRRGAAVAAGGFPTWLGRRGRSLLSSEEAELSRRLWRAGGTIWYEPAATVVHQIGASRLRRRWVLRRGLAQGRSNARRAVSEHLETGTLDSGYAIGQLTDALRTSRQLLDTSRRAGSGDAVLDVAGRLLGHAAAAAEYGRWAGPRLALAERRPG